MEHFVVLYTLQHNVYLSLLCSTHNTNSLSIVIAKNKTTTKIVTLHSRGYPPVPPPRINTSQRLRNEVRKSNITFHLIYQIVNQLSLFGTKTTSDRTYWASTYCTFMICGWDEILGGTECENLIYHHKLWGPKQPKIGHVEHQFTPLHLYIHGLWLRWNLGGTEWKNLTFHHVNHLSLSFKFAHLATSSITGAFSLHQSISLSLSRSCHLLHHPNHTIILLLICNYSTR